MLGKQIAVTLGSAAAIIVLLVAWWELPVLPLPTPDGADIATRLAFVARWLLLPGFALFFGIAAVAKQRFFVADAIDGEPETNNRFLDITLRYNRNTLEQVILAAIAWTGLALALPHAQLKLIPAMAIAFLVGRLLFWIGYMIAPMGRTFGLGLTFYPTVAALIWLAVRMF
jgi:MAPEG family